MDHQYALRIFKDSDQNKYAGVTFLYFKNGVCSSTPHSFPRAVKRRFPVGTPVLVRLEVVPNGVEFEGMAAVSQFSTDGRPLEFGETLGDWREPDVNERIVDERERAELVSDT